MGACSSVPALPLEEGTLQVCLRSMDGIEFKVPWEVACMSDVIKNMVEDLGPVDEESIPLDVIRGNILEKVIHFCRKHKDDRPMLEEDIRDAREEELCGFDEQFVDMDNEMLYELTLAANFLCIRRLVDVTAKKIMLMLRGKTTEEMRDI